MLDLKEGRIVDARLKQTDMKSFMPEVKSYKSWITSLYVLLQAEIMLTEGSLEKAINFCKKEMFTKIPGMDIDQQWIYYFPFLRDVLARAYLQNGELDRAIEEYERLIAFDPASKDRRLVHPLNYYRVAKLYEQKRNRSKAIEHHEKFLDLWKDADPGLPEVNDAKKRLAGLN